MASIFRQPKSSYWWICYYDAQKKRNRVSSGIPIKERRSLARVWLMVANIEANKRLAEIGRLTIKAIRESGSRIYEAVYGVPIPSESVETYLSRWVDKKKAEIRSGGEYASVVQSFLGFLGDNAKKNIDCLSIKEGYAFRDHLAKKVSNGATNRKLKTLRAAFNDAVKEKLISENPFAEVALLKVKPPQKRRGFTVEEIKTLLASCTDQEWHSMILFGYYTGQRLGDLVSLTWGKIDLTPGMETINFIAQKDGKRRIVPICKPLLAHLSTLPHGSPKDPVHPRLYAIRSNSPKASTLSNQFYEIMVSAGIMPSKGKHRAVKSGRDGRHTLSEVSFHSFRHSFVTDLKARGISRPIVQELAGHSSEAVNEVYTNFEDQTMRSAVNTLPVLEANPLANPDAQ